MTISEAIDIITDYMGYYRELNQEVPSLVDKKTGTHLGFDSYKFAEDINLLVPVWKKTKLSTEIVSEYCPSSDNWYVTVKILATGEKMITPSSNLCHAMLISTAKIIKGLTKYE